MGGTNSSINVLGNGETSSTNAMNGPAPIAVYLYAGDQIIENVTVEYFYFQDSLGNTSHVTDGVGNLLERYTYGAFGQPYFFDPAGNPRGVSADNPQGVSGYGIRHLFQGQLWTQETRLNDYRNRVELPTMGVFLQPDPIGFKGDAANTYRFCNNNAMNRIDPMGLDWAAIDSEAESWALKASEQNLAARQAEGRFQYWLNRFQHSEFGTTVYRENGKTGMSQPYTDGDTGFVRGRNYAGKTSLVYSHTHNHNKNSEVTKSHLSVPDIRVANNTGVPVQVTTPSGEVDRARPSTAKTKDGRWDEGATIERLNSETRTFETLKNANARVPRYGPVGEGMAGQDESGPSAKDVDAANRPQGVPSLGAEAVNFVRASRL